MKSLFRITLIAILLLPATTFAASFSDVSENHSNYDAIESLKQANVVNGYEDRTFKPDNKVNRAEALKMITIASDIYYGGSSVWESFSDVEDNQWFYIYINAAVGNNIVNGYDDGTFKPDRHVNLAEALKMTFMSFDIDKAPVDFDDPYADVSKDFWFAPYASYAASKNITSVDANSSLHADREMTRGQLAELLYRFQYVKDNNSNAFPIPLVGHKIIEAARNQIGVVTSYDTSYYSGGYPPEDRGACTDVIEHALRDNGYDLKTKIDNDMWNYPSRYPHDPDPNINYRRVINVKAFFDYYAQSLSTCTETACLKEGIWQPGDIVTYNQMEGGLWHIAIISDRTIGDTPLLIHNYGRGTVEDNMLLTWPATISGHYRVTGI